MVQESTCTHTHEYRLLGASCYSCTVAAWVKVSAPFFLFFRVTFVHANLCQPANFYNYAKNELQIKTFFFHLPAGIELATSESAVQCLIHWATAASLNLLLQKLIFNCQAHSQGPRIFSRWQPLFRASSKCLWSVSIIMLAIATPQSTAMKRPLESLEPYNYPHQQTENLYDTKTRRELEPLRSLHV